MLQKLEIIEVGEDIVLCSFPDIKYRDLVIPKVLDALMICFDVSETPFIFDLSESNLQALPGIVREFSHVRDLILSNNQLRSIPAWVSQQENWGMIYVQENPIELLPLDLRELAIDEEQFFLLEDQITSMPNLAVLDMSICGLSDVPMALLNLTQLIELNLSWNELKELPSNIAELSQLKRLALYKNRIQSVQPLMALTSLLFLNLGENHLEEIPLGLEELSSLEELVLANNRLSSLPDNLENWLGLQRLDLRENLFSKEEIQRIQSQLLNTVIQADIELDEDTEYI